jgi:hypothetical protein
MSEIITAQYVRAHELAKSNHPELTTQVIKLRGDMNFGDPKIHMGWEWITMQGEMVRDHHKHNFDEYLTFLGGESKNILELNAEVELILSTDGINKEKHIITKSTTIFIPKGLYHCPLIIKKIDKPFLFIENYSTEHYTRE